MLGLGAYKVHDGEQGGEGHGGGHGEGQHGEAYDRKAPARYVQGS